MVVMMASVIGAIEKGTNISRQRETSDLELGAISASQKRKQTGFFLLNPDARLVDNCLEKILHACEKDPEIHFVAPVHRLSQDNVWCKKKSCLSNVRVALSRLNQVLMVPFVSGAAMFISSKAYRQLGGFDERLFLFLEDDDLCFRYYSEFGSIALLAEAQIEHLSGMSSKSDVSYLKDFHWGKSEFYVLRKHRGLYSASLMAANHFVKLLSPFTWLDKSRRMRWYGRMCGIIYEITN